MPIEEVKKNSDVFLVLLSRLSKLPLFTKCSLRTWVNSSASHNAMSSEASDYSLVSECCTLQLHVELTLNSSELKSINNVSNITLAVSTSSPSLLRLLIRFLNAPEATEAGYNFAKLLKPKMAALRSSTSVALCSRALRVFIVSVAFCFAGA